MIQVFNNILYYLNLAALLHYHHQESISNISSVISNGTLDDNNAGNNATNLLPPVLKQIPPGPILPGIMVKFVCAVNSGGDDGGGGGGGEAGSICGNTVSDQNEVSYQWEMYHYTEDSNGSSSCTSIIKLPGQDAEMEIKFNETVADPKTRCDLVCTISNNVTTAPAPSSAFLKLHFQASENTIIPTAPLTPPSNFKLLDITSRAAYFAWHPPRYNFKFMSNGGITGGTSYDPDSFNYPEITGYIIEYKNSRATTYWQHDKVSRYQVKDGSTFAACVSGLSPWTTYHFRIMTLSNNNESAPSLPILVRTAEDFPSAPPMEVKVKAIDQNILLASWKPPPRTTWNGALLGYNIGLKKVSSQEDEPYEIHMLHPQKTLGTLYSQRITVFDSAVPYKVVVQAFNNVGIGPFSYPVIQTRMIEEE